MNRPDKKNKTLITVVTALIFCGFFVMAGFLAIPEAYADTSNYIFSGSWDNELHKLDSNGQNIWKYTEHNHAIEALAVDQDGYIYSTSRDFEVHKLDSNGQNIWKYTEHDNAVEGVAVDQDGYIYSGSWDNEVHKKDPNGQKVWKYTEHSDDVTSVAVDQDGYIYSTSRDNELHKIDPNGQNIWKYTEHSDRLESVTVDQDGYIYSGSLDNEIHKIDPNGQNIWKYDGDSTIYSISIDQDGYIYSAVGTEVHKLDSNGQNVWKYFEHTRFVNSVTVDQDGYIYSASTDDEVHKIDPNGQKVWKYTEHSETVVSLASLSSSEPSEPFDGFEAITKPADPYSLNEYVLASEVLNFGNYDFEASDNHLAQGVKVFDEDGQVIHEPAMNIINDFETPADFSTVFEAEPGETYGYRWRYYYIDYLTGQTIDSKLTPLEVFTHEVDEEAPELETLNAQYITDTSAELRGRVSSLGAYESLEISFEWVEAGGEEWNETDPVATLNDTFEYPATVWDILDNLEPATTYYYRIKADEYRGNRVSFTTAEEPIDDPHEPAPVDWQDWESFYDQESDEEFDYPVGVIDGIGTTFDGIMGSIINRIEPFRERLESDQAYIHGREAGEFIPTMRGYLIELRPFFGGLPVAEVFVFFLIFQVVILGIKGVMVALGFLPFF